MSVVRSLPQEINYSAVALTRPIVSQCPRLKWGNASYQCNPCWSVCTQNSDTGQILPLSPARLDWSHLVSRAETI